MAASKNASTVVDLLVRYGAPLNATEMGGSTAMHIACTNGFVKVVEILIMGGADCDKPNRIGWSPLHLACLGMHHDVIEKLCISGMCNPNSTCTITKEVRVGKSSFASSSFRSRVASWSSRPPVEMRISRFSTGQVYRS